MWFLRPSTSNNSRKTTRGCTRRTDESCCLSTTSRPCWHGIPQQRARNSSVARSPIQRCTVSAANIRCRRANRCSNLRICDQGGYANPVQNFLQVHSVALFACTRSFQNQPSHTECSTKGHRSNGQKSKRANGETPARLGAGFLGYLGLSHGVGFSESAHSCSALGGAG